MSEADGVHVERLGAVARVTIDRPDRANAIDLATARALMDAAIACDRDEAVRCVLLTGQGRFFCTGGDLASFAEAGDGISALLGQVTAALHAAVATFARMEKPLVTAVNGAAAGAGLSLAIMGDIVLAAPGAQFTAAYTGIGLSPDGGATWLLPRLIGLRRAQELCLRNTRVSAADAVAMGLATRIVESDLAEEALSVAQALATGATGALSATRRLLLDSFTTTLETQMEREARSIAALAARPHGREGVAAFLEKRSPHYR